ncbi:MAG: hypothetical protein LBI01_01595 [Elusimicrobium sp.]|jgi:hypothetical protein|nr:hypothetical protein [Elusimicrobium sp.]
MNETDERKVPAMMVILLKAAVLVLIVLCIFFIAYPHACINIIEGRQTEDQSIQDINKPLIQANRDTVPAPQPVVTAPVTVTPPSQTVTIPAPQPVTTQQTVITPATAVQTVQTQVTQTARDAQNTTNSALNSAIQQQQQLQAEQDVYDYNVIKRYVAVEKDYLQTHANDNASATAVTQQVMNEYQLNDQEWKEIISKANERGWFDALRNK